MAQSRSSAVWESELGEGQRGFHRGLELSQHALVYIGKDPVLSRMRFCSFTIPPIANTMCPYVTCLALD
jgi:hypothetical protein